MQIKILHLYYDIMNMYGDYANVYILKKHIEDQGISVELNRRTIGSKYNVNDYDFVYIGSGTNKSLYMVYEDIKLHKNEFIEYINSKKIILATGNSYEMFGKKIDEEEMLGIFDLEVKREKCIMSSNIIYESEFFKKETIGFFNREDKTYHNNNPLFRVVYGIGENENNDYEGVKYKGFYGTHISGPILVKNPNMLEKFVIEICKDKNSNFKLKDIDYKIENNCYEYNLKELIKRK